MKTGWIYLIFVDSRLRNRKDKNLVNIREDKLNNNQMKKTCSQGKFSFFALSVSNVFADTSRSEVLLISWVFTLEKYWSAFGRSLHWLLRKLEPLLLCHGPRIKGSSSFIRTLLFLKFFPVVFRGKMRDCLCKFWHFYIFSRLDDAFPILQLFFIPQLNWKDERTLLPYSYWTQTPIFGFHNVNFSSFHCILSWLFMPFLVTFAEISYCWGFSSFVSLI